MKTAPSLLLLVVLICAGCATAGKKFNYEGVPSLEIGGLTTGDYQATFGPPSGTESSKSADGAFLRASYAYAAGNVSTTAVRVLALEFKDGRLNAWIYVSGFEEDATSTNFEALNQIATGRSSKNDVLMALGRPNGKARCPSTLVDYKDRCKSEEVWVWSAYPRQATFGGKEHNLIFVQFDPAGIVAGVEQIKAKTPS